MPLESTCIPRASFKPERLVTLEFHSGIVTLLGIYSTVFWLDELKSDLLAVPESFKSINASFEDALFIVAVIVTSSPSLAESEEIEIEFNVGLSSLTKLNKSEEVSWFAFSTVPISTWIVSNTSTMLSSNPLFVMLIVPLESPALIINGESVIKNSLSLVAVPEVVNGILIFFSEILSSLILISIESSEFSCKYFLSVSNVRLDGSSLSVNVTVILSVDEKVPDEEEKGLKIIVLSSSSIISGIPEIVNSPDVSPAAIDIWGAIAYFFIRLLFLSATYKFPESSTWIPIDWLNWSSFEPLPTFPATNSLLTPAEAIFEGSITNFITLLLYCSET